MTKQEEAYFIALSADRADSANMLEKPSMRGVRTSVVEKYSDQAHFIYELLQNADDAGATSARFILHDQELIFAHNGIRRFSISDPDTEEEDSRNGTLGDINAITSIANSNKTTASIGKFGVGFKAVFQYTQTPRIYDPNFRFKIERFIVPVRLDNDFDGRHPEETLFVLPFDHPDRSPVEAYDDIYDKLRSLVYPVLFLTNLNKISYECPGQPMGQYNKSIQTKIQFGTTVAELVNVTNRNNDANTEEKLWLFSRTEENGYRYSLGFLLDDEGELKRSNHAAFCFFPTKEVTGLNFMIHAPFLLTDSREGIKSGEFHNKYMINLLAKLAADGLTYLKNLGLINDRVFEIIPYDQNKFTDVNSRDRISFKPFYTAIKERLTTDELLPSSDGFVSAENAYWASVPQIPEIFSDSQLAYLCQNNNAQWVFTSFGRDETLRANSELTNYIDAITKDWFNHEDMIGFVSAEFIEIQPIDWLHQFYKYVADTAGRTKLIKTKKVFLNQDSKAVAAFDATGQPILFLPTEDIDGYETVSKVLLQNEETALFIQQLGITTPSLKDEIYNKILPLYKDNNQSINTLGHFKKFFQYYLECSQSESDAFIHNLKEYNFLLFRSNDDPKLYRGKPGTLYFPDDSIRQWFINKPDTRFLALEKYVNLSDSNNTEALIGFLTRLGVRLEPKVFSRELSYEEALLIKMEWPYSSRSRRWIEPYIDGCQEVLLHATPDTSVVIWDQLLKIIASRCSHWNTFSRLLLGTYEYFYRSQQNERFISRDAMALRKIAWLLNRNGELVSAEKLTIQTLSSTYNTTSDEARELLQFLGIKDEAALIPYNNLTEDQRAKIAFADTFADVPQQVLIQAAEEYRNQLRALNSQSGNPINQEPLESEEDGSSAQSPITRVAKEITRRAVSPSSRNTSPNDTAKDGISSEEDEDDYIKPSVDFLKKIEQAKQRSAEEISKIAQLDEITQQALSSKKYSYRWFQALLELEMLNSKENIANSREISITFSKVEREEGTSRTLILKHPNRHIPHSMEDLADIPLELSLSNQPPVKVAVEVVSVKSYTLRAKLRSNAEIDGVDLSLVTEARIEARNPVFLLEELKKSFNSLDFDADYDLQKNLCKNIEFIFGPPGTGKTTHLAKEVILPIMREPDDRKILVLTPTNKAADVLVRRIIDSMDCDSGYTDWLIRFGSTDDSVIERSGVFRDKTFDIRTLPRNVTVTTIARFPYDYFLPDQTTRLHLSDLKWDYIIIDEASMIPLVNVVLPLYKKTPKKFIIAGDPFQIEPITTVDIWKNENIYTMVKLNSFNDPTTVPHSYPTKLLTTQYRSIPSIGEVFSRFAYGGVLRHNRSSDSHRRLDVNEYIDLKPLTIFKFPVSKFESIYRPKRLAGKSSYQVYSALFAFELVKHLSSLIELQHGDEFFRIGVIAPYRAQADLVDKLVSSVPWAKNIDIQVGTIHGFQGDECDIIIALFNPPPSISASKEMFLNKINIINVSISRARDYLILIMPDDNTENIGHLTLIKQIEKLCKEQSDWIEHHSHSIEELIFGSQSYLEDNSFSTGHQLVNVYGKAEKRYEVRSEDTSVDVQIYE
ncbi:superfamily I DNA/RNA helicase [Sulfobacillus acidophilus DSM 10332]|uniref:Superfamily I DNA/RNA helicase n=1 Tax=Sulfobacillus acidophilus (strain ATCC 700253 / DSM 10332 / NAL) TaxID=679936 RepID=G8TVK2_SULAD|nr:superfamily I DNA/RNA helicase [Sulfobacillus acidophilus DSM 10332]